MKKKQKLLAALLALVMTLSLLAACGETPAEGPASQTSVPEGSVSEAGAPEAEAPEASTPAEAESSEVPAEDAADLVLTNGVVETMNDGQEAEAVAVKGGEIVFVGTSAEAEAFIGADTQVIDLDGRNERGEVVHHQRCLSDAHGGHHWHHRCWNEGRPGGSWQEHPHLRCERNL